ncbi:MAG TPA: gamma-glutamylcyclotransferase family protein [Dehalococcoidales bacterium]|nr:gamma-glutamylcyclotransferase family protein [Dehalococcoidales bacterium]
MYYFAYGSNLSKKQMRERCPESKPRLIAVLPNYKLVFTDWSRQWRGGVVTIKRFSGEKVLGAIYEITESDLRRLDKYEGYPQSYGRINVIVFDDNNQPIEAMTYIKAGQLKEAPPSKEYLAVIQQGYRDWEIV